MDNRLILLALMRIAYDVRSCWFISAATYSKSR